MSQHDSIEQAPRPAAPTNDGTLPLLVGGATVLRIENETQQALMLQRPRDINKVIDNALRELDAAPLFALSVFYSIPYKDRSGGDERTVDVEGTGTHGAAMLARLWGNNAHGVRITGADERHVYMEGVFMDYETNTRTSRPFVVNKFAYRHVTKTEIPLSARDLQIAIQAGVSKADRNAIMASLPPALKLAFFNKARMIALNLATPENVNALLATCDEHRVARGKVMAFIGAKSTADVKGPVFVRLAALANALSQGEATAADIGIEPREKTSKSAVADLTRQQALKPTGKQPETGTTSAPDGPGTTDPAPNTPAAPVGADNATSSDFDTLKRELTALGTVDDVKAWGKSAGARMVKLTTDELTTLRTMYAARLDTAPPAAAKRGRPKKSA